MRATEAKGNDDNDDDNDHDYDDDDDDSEDVDEDDDVDDYDDETITSSLRMTHKNLRHFLILTDKKKPNHILVNYYLSIRSRF